MSVGQHARRFLAVVVLVGSLATTASAAPSPPTLYRRLLVQPFPVAQLPSSLRSPARLSRLDTAALARFEGALGGVRVTLSKGPSTIDYVIFPTHAEALAAWLARVEDHESGDQQSWAASDTTPVLPTPSRLYLGLEFFGGGQRLTTLAFFVDGPALIEATTTVTAAAVHYNKANTVTLARVAHAHLLEVER